MYIVAILYTALAIIGLLGNLWTLFAIGQLFSRSSKVQSSACIYLLMLSLVDLISFFPVPLLAMDILHGRWIYSTILCKFLYACEGVNKSLSPWVLTALSVDRYIAVCRPTFVWMRQSKFAFCVLMVCILISSLFIAPVTIQSNVEIMLDLGGKLLQS
jgi:nociceptin receptor